MFIETLKKHRWSLLKKWGVSSAGLLLILLIILAILLLIPVTAAAFFLWFSLNPIVFSFLFLGLLLLGGAIASVIWFSIEYKVNETERNSGVLDSLLANKSHDISDHRGANSQLEDDKMQKNNVVLIKDTEEDDSNEDPIEQFRLRGQTFIQNLRDAVLNSDTNEQETLKSEFNQLKKNYYALALKYHPDKMETDAKEQESKTSHFQRLSKIYQEIKEAFISLKESQNNQPFDELLKENIQVWQDLSVEIANLKNKLGEQNEKFQQKLDKRQQELDELSEVATMVRSMEKEGVSDQKIGALIAKVSQHLASSASAGDMRTENVTPNEASFSFSTVTTTISTFFSSVFAKLDIQINSNRDQPTPTENAKNTVT